MKRTYILSLSFFFCISATYAQNDKLGTISVDIVKPYTPTIADVQKSVEETPKKDSVTITKKKITYTIHSVPVASTFVPEKGKAVRVNTAQQRDTLYHSYLALGAGSYTSFLADAFVAVPLSASSDFSVDLQHHSSQGKIKEVPLDTDFANTQAQAAYRYGNSQYQLGAIAGINHRLLHWYGVEDKSFLPIENSLKQNYLSGGLSAYFSLNNSIFKGADFSVQGIKDDFSSGETHLQLKPSFLWNFNEQQAVKARLDLDYLQGSFANGFSVSDKIGYKVALLGIKPAYQFSNELFSGRLGLGAYYLKQNKGDSGTLKLFPDLELAYDALGDGLIIYGGIIGDLKQVTYREKTQENPYLSPTQDIQPTYTPYHIFIGVKGALTQGFSYDVNVFYDRVEGLPLFQANEKLSLTQYKTYQYDNTYKLLYQDVMRYGIQANLLGKISDQFTLDFSLQAMDFSMDKNAEQPWNIPSFTTGLTAYYQLIPNWNIGTTLFYVGERKDLKHTLATSPKEEVTLKGFFDLNFSTDYTFLKRWTVFVNFNNVTGKHYERWTNYPVQGFQVLGGLKYRFNVK